MIPETDHGRHGGPEGGNRRDWFDARDCMTCGKPRLLPWRGQMVCAACWGGPKAAARCDAGKADDGLLRFSMFGASNYSEGEGAS